MIVGDNINIPSASSMFATTKSRIINGTNIIKLISNDVFNSLIMYAGATSHIEISSGDVTCFLCESSAVFQNNSGCALHLHSRI